LKVKQIFSRDPERKIKSVILANDESTIAQEVDEFVLTNDTAKQLRIFLEEYVDGSDQQAIGVWFSGFYGSGKSHLLKMVAHLLGNVPGSSIGQSDVAAAFDEKASTSSQGAFLQGLLKKVSSTRAKVLLFNISHQYQVNELDDTANALRVFCKIWNESLGLSSLVGVAEFEKSLLSNGQLEQFKSSFSNKSGHDWEAVRGAWYGRLPDIAHAFEEATGSSLDANALTMILSSTNYPSPAELGEQIGQWLDKNNEYDRVIFMVDEVGQFIGTNSKIMLDLQSVVESFFGLNRRVWVGVTSQEDLDNTLEKFKQSGNDFEKISQRFKLRFQLTSTSVREVIQKRLLAKKEGSKGILTTIYKESEIKILNSLAFRDVAKNLVPYKDEGDFVNTYPLIGWHLDILTESIREISDRKGFTGVMVDVGARSTLGIFQDVIRSIGEEEVGALVTMDRMYEGISNILKVPYKQSVEFVDQNSKTDLEKRLIRVLLMVKHVSSFKPTPTNLAVLLASSISESQIELMKDVEVALKSLTSDLYVERRGNEYYYLTSIEKDIEKEISRVSIDPNEIEAKLFDLLQDAYPKNFFKHDETGRDFRFNVKLNDFFRGAANHELTLRYVRSDQPDQVEMAKSAGVPDLRVLLESDSALDEDLIHFLKTEKFLNQHSGSSDKAEQGIIDAKYKVSSALKAELATELGRRLSSASLISNGQRLEVQESSDLVKRMALAWHLVVRQVYVQLDLAKSHRYSLEEVKLALTSSQEGLISSPPPAASEVLSKLSALSSQNQAVSVKQILDVFETKPYGWELNSILYFVSVLIAGSEITLKRDGRLLSRAEAAKDLASTNIHQSLLLSPAPKVDHGLILKVRNILIDDFGVASPSSDLVTLGREIRVSLEKLGSDIHQVKSFGAPFTNCLAPMILEISELIAVSEEALVSDSLESLQNLGREKFELFNPIWVFYNNQNQRAIYENAVELKKASQADIELFGGHDGVRLFELLEDPELLSANRVPQLKKYYDSLLQKLAVETKLIVDHLLQSLSDFAEKIKDVDLFKGATPGSIMNFEAKLANLEMAFSKIRVPSEAQALASRFESLEKKNLSELLVAEQGDGEEPMSSISLSTLASQVESGAVLESEIQIDEYLASLRAILVETAKTKRIIC
jgi:hypothetical protein